MARNSPIDDDEAEAAPLPDRTRVEPSPFAEGGAGGARARSNGSRRRAPSPPSSSIIVDEALDAPSPRRPSGRRPKAPAPPEPDYPDYDEPSEPDPYPPHDDSNATRIAPAPSERRPAARPVQDENATSAGPPVTVEVLAGPDRGVRLPIRGGRMIVGRGDGCDLKLTDTSVSRRHVELTAGPGGIVLRDLGSGNGTRVNGESQVETVLEHGAEVALGETVLKIIDELKRVEEERAARQAPPARRPAPRAVEEEPAEEPEEELVELRQPTGRLPPIPVRHLPPREQPGLLGRFAALPKPMKLLLLGGTGLVLLIAVLALFTPPKRATPPGEPPEVRKQRQFDELMQQANNFYRERKYREAQDTYLEAGALMDSPKAADAASRCARNLEAKRTLSDAEALAAGGEFDRAIERVKGLPEGDSEYADEAKEKVAEWGKAKVKADLEAVRAAIEAGEFDQARGLVDALPFEHQEPQRRTLAEAEKDWKANAALRQRQAKAAAARARAAAAQRLRQEVDSAISPIVRKMEQGNFDGAVRECERVAESARLPAVAKKVQMMKSRIPAFGQAFNEGMSRFNGGAYEPASGALLRAFKLLEDMDLDTKLDKTLRDKAGQALVHRGRAAVGRRDYGAGARAYKDALRLNPNSSQAHDGLRIIRAAAQEVYSEGYAIMNRDPDAARKRFRDVLEMVPKGDELAGKAQMRLDSMQR